MIYVLVALLALVGCDRATSTPARQVVVYCSADAPVAQPVFDAFEKKTGIHVLPVFDTEATKTTGLVNRLLAEHERGGGGADVWWSSEPFGTIRLARAGVLEKYESPIAASAWDGVNGVAPGRWPGARASDETWYGFARRLRVVIYNNKFVTPADGRINGWMDLSKPQFKGRVGMARPQFGATRGHMAVMHAIDEGKTLRSWLEALVANDVRLFDGNAAVAKAVASGELYIGLTDSDDAINGIRAGWPVGVTAISERGSPPSGTINHMVPRLLVEGMEIPNTCALARGGKNPTEARALLDFLISRDAAELLAAGEACALKFGDTWIPELRGLSIEQARAKERSFGLLAIEGFNTDFERYADHIEPAMKLCDEILKGR